MTNKPPYAVPTMDEIRTLPWNGFNAVSTFSGCGGSSLGDRMAGFRMLWASEFIPAAQETYKANSAPYTVLDTRDIRQVRGRDILDATGLDVGGIDLFDGSPPCSSFSTAGKREQGWGSVKKYSDSAQRTDDLFYEYARLIEETQPRTFIAENVSGLVKGTAKGYFKLILARLKECGYRVEARLLDASWLGVPQARKRLIFIGVRNDLGALPVFPKPLPYQYNAGEAVAGLNTQPGTTTDPETGVNINLDGYAFGREWHKLRHGESSEKYFQLVRPDPRRPYPTITTKTTQGGGGAAPCHWDEPRSLTLRELRRVGGFPDDFILRGDFKQRHERIGRAVPPVMMSHIASAVRDRILIPLRDKEAAK